MNNVNEFILIILVLIPPLSALGGVFLGFWIAWRCLKQIPLIEKEPESLDEPTEELPRLEMTDNEIDDGFGEIV